MKYLITLLLAVSANAYGQKVSYEKVSEVEFKSLAFRSTMLDENGVLWLGTRDQGIYRWKGENYYRLTFSDANLAMNGASSIVSHNDGNMYFTGRDVGVLNIATGDWSRLTSKDLKSTVVFNARVLGNVVFFSGNRGVSILSRHEGVLFLNDSLAEVYPVVHDLISDNDERFWLATRKGGLIVSNKAGDGWDQFFPETNCWKLFKSANGDIWVGSNKGLIHYTYANESFEILKEGELLLPDFEDEKGNLWMSSESQGIWTYDGASWEQVSEGGSFGVFSAANGTTWSLSKKGLIKIN